MASQNPDGMDLLDFGDYESVSQYSPAALSPAAVNKPQYARPSTRMATPPTMPAAQSLSGPSHQYDQYKQQTPFVPGALASTLAVHESNAHIGGYPMEFIPSDVNAGDEVFDFNRMPPRTMNTADMEVDFEGADQSYFFAEQTINPNAIGGRESQPLASPTVPSQTSNVGRMYPGMHQQAALAKAQAQQRQQQQIIQQQQQQRQQQVKNRSKGPTPQDPMVEQKITQLLNSMRARAENEEDQENSPLLQIPRPKKEEDDMDEDERLLASEEGKKLSSKERRQLRNKVSARAFRSRRKEYISQLESEIATRVTENGDLRAQNRALLEENRRLSDLTRTLLSSPSFSSFLDQLSTNPNLPLRPQQQQIEEPHQVPKDINPFAGQQVNNQRQQIGMVMIPEQTMDFSMLNLNSDSYNYQPQVFTVLETSHAPEIDLDALTGKSSNFVGEPLSETEKNDAPVLESPVLPSVEKSQAPESPAESTPSESSVADLDGDIYDEETTESSKPMELNMDSITAVINFEDIKSEKELPQYELVDATEEDIATSRSLRRVERLAASLKAITARLDQWTIGL
ncbi:hypothetical protein F5B20DRAFT_217644 [Whalleya microplaca]|nr:hypothetical protein F5B20DRAFT_217644 [Whalleya microplaca]